MVAFEEPECGRPHVTAAIFSMRNRPCPTQSGQRANRYSYGFGSPQNGTDPSGHVFLLVIGAAVGWNALGWGVRYSAEPVNSGPRTVPMAFRMKAYGVNPDGSQGIQVNRAISNSLYRKKFNQWRNIGVVTQQGVAAPTAGTP
ncbi:hypothetical protein [Streptomyces anulatus]|uniref:hypothetical protein n=1 Tax=Streptomyces anulatus TaxID=1892 RepID=UPI003328C277